MEMMIQTRSLPGTIQSQGNEWLKRCNPLGPHSIATFSTQSIKQAGKGFGLEFHIRRIPKSPSHSWPFFYTRIPIFGCPIWIPLVFWPKFQGCPWTSLASTISSVLALKMPSGIGPLGPFDCWRRRIRTCQMQLATGTMKPQLDLWDDWAYSVIIQLFFRFGQWTPVQPVHSFSWMVYLALSEGMMCNLLMFWESVVGMFRCRAEHDYCESKQSRRHHTAETKIVYPVLGKKNHFAFGDTTATQYWWCFCSWLVVSIFSTTLVVISFTILKLSHNITDVLLCCVTEPGMMIPADRKNRICPKMIISPKWI